MELRHHGTHLKLKYVIRDKYAIGSGFAWRRSLWPGWAPIGLFPTEQDAARAVYWRRWNLNS
jgi:hypothetical protein